MSATSPDQHCYCGRERSFAECCGPIIAGEQQAAHAEDLMRSRYSAFVVGDAEYLKRSWHPGYRPTQLTIDPQQRWLGLKIKDTLAGGPDDQSGEVEFVARYKIAGRGHRRHERSRFGRHNGQWVYLDGLAISKHG